MLKRILLLLIVFFGCVMNNIHAQEETPDKKQAKIKARADERYDEYSFSPAIDIYKKVLDKGFVSIDLLKRLGNSYYFNAKYEEASNIYKKLIETYPKKTEPDYYFRYAQSLKTVGKYEDASQMMKQFKQMTSDVEGGDLFDEDYMATIEKNSGRYSIKPFEYNSKYSDFAASFYEQGLIFSSDRDTGNLARYRHTWNSKDFLDLYKVNADSVSNNTVVKLEGDVNTRLRESASIIS